MRAGENGRKPHNPADLWSPSAVPLSAYGFPDLTAQIVGIEWIVVLIVIAILLLFGPQKLPELARGIGRAMGEFRRGKAEVERQLSTELSDYELKEQRGRIDRAAAALGVPSTGKSEMQLKLDIARAVDKATDDQVVAASQAVGVYTSGADVHRLKEQIIKTLNV